MKDFTPFANESDAAAIGQLTIENRTNRVSVYGDIDLTRDRRGLANALELKRLLDDIVRVLQAEPALPEVVAVAPVLTIKNPFQAS